jgi:hypothetical protein
MGNIESQTERSRKTGNSSKLDLLPAHLHGAPVSFRLTHMNRPVAFL